MEIEVVDYLSSNDDGLNILDERSQSQFLSIQMYKKKKLLISFLV